MGGPGSGRHWYWDAKRTTDSYRSIDVRQWKRDGLLKPNQTFLSQWSYYDEVTASICVRTESDRVILTDRQRNGSDDWENNNYHIYLDWTDCNLGGQRPWFVCPASDCGRRVAILYGGNIFACRDCYQLAYQSQRETYYDRAARRADKIREKLGWEPGILNGNGWKPTGMHKATFERLTIEYDAFARVSLAGIAKRLNLTLPEECAPPV